MSSNVLIDRTNISIASRLVFTIAPYTLVRIGPKLNAALNTLIADLVAALHNAGKAAQHLTTTYSLANLALVFECSEKEEEGGTHIQRLRLVGGKITGYAFEDKKLSCRIAKQLQSILTVRPNLPKPFMCVESWRGAGSQHHPIYARMVEASTSVEAWKKFKATLTAGRSVGNASKRCIDAIILCDARTEHTAKRAALPVASSGPSKLKAEHAGPRGEAALSSLQSIAGAASAHQDAVSVVLKPTASSEQEQDTTPHPRVDSPTYQPCDMGVGGECRVAPGGSTPEALKG